jgi:GNAT superfamily N-acetyltransferase
MQKRRPAQFSLPFNDYDNVSVSDVIVRRAGQRELDDAWAIVSEYYDAVSVVARESREVFEREYFGEGAGIWLATTAEGVVGCIALRPLSGIPHAGEVKRLYVKPAGRGQGIAGLLLDALHNYARAASYDWLYLDSKDDLETAIRFYEKQGYEHCDRYNDNPQATIFMRKRITS